VLEFEGLSHSKQRNEQTKDSHNIFHNLNKFKVYRADDKDVSYMRDFTRYAEYTNSLIFNEKEAVKRNKRQPLLGNSNISHDTFRDLSEEH
jgi:hypothetical protein